MTKIVDDSTKDTTDDKNEDLLLSSSSQLKRRRLSRKEQKARKKQHRQPRQQTKQLDNHTSNHEDNSTKIEEGKVIDYRETYVPISVLKKSSSETAETTAKHSSSKATTTTKIKSNNKWFPKAITVKQSSVLQNQHHQQNQSSSESSSCSILLFYQYVSPEWDERTVHRLTEYLVSIGEHRPIGGRIRIAPEGLNATLSSIDASSALTAAATLRHFAYDLQAFDSVAFAKTDFKYTDHLRSDRHFKQLVILPVREIVYYGLRESDAPIAKTGNHVPPEQFHKMLQGKDGVPTVVIDVRNHYEAQLGRFDGQQQQAETQTISTTTPSTTGDSNNASAPAQYLDPKMRKSTDWKTYLQDPSTQQTIAGKRVLLYCTGGIRCERASAYLNSIAETILPKPPQQVYQLQGGIEKYLQTFRDGGFWRGKNFVFDKREAVGASDPNGDGGVLGHPNGESNKNKSPSATSTLPSSRKFKRQVVEGCTCVVCHKPWDRYVGKRKCSYCGVPVLVCDTCLTTTQHHQNSHNKNNQPKHPPPPTLQCPLCVEQNVTVPVHEVEYTDNGIRSKANPTIALVTTKIASSASLSQEKSPENDTLKVAPSILKWGGGHAAVKKMRRKCRGKPCKFGAQCNRPDCFFSHPPGA
jgi:predicted sulfurtransferase